MSPLPPAAIASPPTAAAAPPATSIDPDLIPRIESQAQVGRAQCDILQLLSSHLSFKLSIFTVLVAGQHWSDPKSQTRASQGTGDQQNQAFVTSNKMDGVKK